MTRPAFERHDLSSARRVLTVGDIHGCFDRLERQLDELGFDPDQDVLVLLGDLVDRGPHSDQALEWCDRAGVRRVLGNHEQIVDYAVNRGAKGFHHRAGGIWFEQIVEPEKRRNWAETLMDAPVAMEITTPGGRRVGFVHADVPTNCWTQLEKVLTSPDHPEHDDTWAHCMWERHRIDRIEHLRDNPESARPVPQPIRGIDHVFFGHTIVHQALTHQNCSFIDTGAFRGGDLTIVDVDAWLDRLDQQADQAEMAA
ncbi:metallophosphoesterase [Erythrobacter aureus]|nr:metallophosphoesterase [Erythrobacter aureus]